MARTLVLIYFTLFFAGVCLAEGPAAPKVGMLLPLSGSYAALGKDNREGVESALAELPPGSKLNVLFADSKADPTTAVGEFRKLATVDHVVAAFAMRGPVGMALNPISRSSTIPLLGGVGNKDFTTSNEYAFQIWPRSDEEGAFLAAKVMEQGLSEVALITAQDDWTNAVAKGFREAFTAKGGKIVFDQDVIPADNDFRTLLLQMAGKAPKAVITNLALSQIAPMLKQMKERKVSVPVYSNFWVGKKDVIEAAGIDVVEGVRFAEMDTDMPALREHLQATYGSTPSGATLSAYVATMLLGQAAGASTDGKNVFESLAKQTEVKTADHVFAINDRRVQFPIVLKVMKDGKAIKQ